MPDVKCCHHVVWIAPLILLLILGACGTNSDPILEDAAGPITISYVRETAPGSGAFVRVDDLGLPIFIPNDGIGMGGIGNLGTQIDFYGEFLDEIVEGQLSVLDVFINAPRGVYQGLLTEIESGSGVFEDDSGAVSLTFEDPLSSPMQPGEAHSIAFASELLQLSGEPLLVYSADTSPPSLAALSLNMRVELSESLDSEEPDMVDVFIRTKLDFTEFQDRLQETERGSLQFEREAADISLRILDPPELSPTSCDRIRVVVESDFLVARSFEAVLKETDIASKVFSNLPPVLVPRVDRPAQTVATSEQARFHIEVAAPGFDEESIDMSVKTSVDEIALTAFPIGKETYRSNPIVLMPEGSPIDEDGPRVLFVDDRPPPGGRSVVTELKPPFPPAAIAKPMPTKGSAFVGLALTGLAGHTSAIVNTLRNKLGLATTEDSAVYRSDLKRNLPKHDIFYILCHGVSVDGTDNTPFKKIAIWKGLAGTDQVGPADIKPLVGNNPYFLVFINGCQSADAKAGSNAVAFADAFQASAYIGWTRSVYYTNGRNAAEKFFEALDGGSTVAQAVLSVQQSKPGYYSSLRVVRGGGLTLDLKP